MKTLYPPIKPYKTHELSVQNPHVLYIEESGTPDGIPVVFLHGGPGAGASGDDRCFFDPENYRIIIFDQRGCGRSSPHGSLENNTLEGLLSDIEKIREYLKIDKWMIFGGSWGSTLGLVYAQKYPEKVLGMVLRGIFLCRQQDFDWFYKFGASEVFADYWEKFNEFAKSSDSDFNGCLIDSYSRLLKSDNEIIKMGAAKKWSAWEAKCATLKPSKFVYNKFTNPHTALSLALIETHYFQNKAFLKPNQILDNMGALKDIPAVLVHGRYDLICPLEGACSLHKAWENSSLNIIPDAGHSAFEPSITDALIDACQKMSIVFK